MEIATQAQAPTELCNIHGEPRARLAREFGSSDLPRAELAVNLSEVMPVAIKSPTLIADNDPYDSIKPTVIPDATPQPATETAETQKTDSGAGTNGVKSASNTASVNPPTSQTTQSAPEIRKAVPVQTIRESDPGPTAGTATGGDSACGTGETARSRRHGAHAIEIRGAAAGRRRVHD